MDKLTQYRKIAEETLREYYDLSVGGIGSSSEDQIVVDHDNGHYQLLRVGWSGMQRIYGCPLHIDIKDNKFWIQRDLIDVEGGIAGELMAHGVPKEDIVLAFHAPYKRPYTGFAVA